MKKAQVLAIIDGNLKEFTIHANFLNDVKFFCWDCCHETFEIIDVKWLTK